MEVISIIMIIIGAIGFFASLISYCRVRAVLTDSAKWQQYLVQLNNHLGDTAEEYTEEFIYSVTTKIRDVSFILLLINILLIVLGIIFIIIK